jgi:hypothetical protein
MSDSTERNGNAWSSRAKWAFAVFAIVGAFFLLAEHRAHVLPFLPWLILLPCPLMHMFMHGGHGGHGGHHGGGNRPRDGSGGFSGTRPEGSWDGDAGRKAEDHSHHGGRP